MARSVPGCLAALSAARQPHALLPLGVLLQAAERVAGEIIANNIKPALKKASEQDFLEVVKGTSSYLRGLWVRLNGGSPMHPAGLAAQRAGLDLPMPVGSQEQSELVRVPQGGGGVKGRGRLRRGRARRAWQRRLGPREGG